MDNYGQTMKGPFISELIANITSLTYTSADAGRIIFDQTTGKLFFGDSIANAFRSLADIPQNAVILFESNTQQLGYTLLTDQADGVVYFTDGSGGDVGGGDKVGGTWTQPGHSHTGPSHSHTAPSHTHDMSNHTHTVAAHSHTYSHTHTYSGNTSLEIGQGENRSSSGDNSHYHTYSGTTDGPNTSSTDNASPATGGPSYNQTGAGGSGPTSADGTGSTSSAATANTWRPKGRNYTRQRRN